MNRTTLRNAIRYVTADLARIEHDNARVKAHDEKLKDLARFVAKIAPGPWAEAHAEGLVPRPLFYAVDGHTAADLAYYKRLFEAELALNEETAEAGIVAPGERVTHPGMFSNTARDWVLVTAVGEDFFMGRRRTDGNIGSAEQMFPLDGKWTTANY